VDDHRLVQCGLCQGLFGLCRSCDRGQAYCPEPCRAVARRGVVRAARQRHRDSPEGRADHRDHQRAYRARRGRRVRDLGSKKLADSASVCAGGDASGTEVGPPVIAACQDNNDEFDHGHARPRGDARSGAGHGAGGRDDEGGAGGSIPDAPPGGTHTARRTGALAATTPLRCALCGQPGRWLRNGPTRRARHGRAHSALRGRHCRQGCGPPSPSGVGR
jgi:hypothetical protein